MSMTANVDLFKKYYHNIFIETGTYDGGGVTIALKAGFKEIHSIEFSQKLYEGNIAKFQSYPNVHLYNGDSGYILGEILKTIKEPVTFWLDAHNFNGIFGDRQCPLILELEQIAQHKIKTHTILIDDHRIFKVKEWGISPEEVIVAIKKINPKYNISFEANNQAHDDVIVATI